jgi:hypothetical protein
MSNSHLHQANQHESNSLDSSVRHHRLDTSAWVSRCTHVLQSFRVLTHPRFWYALRLSLRTAFGCMKTLLSKKHWAVDFGPLLERLPCGCLVHDGRTDARSVGTQEIESRYPWASIVELQMFLEGFDVGERYALRTLGKPAQVNAESSSASHSERCILQAKPQIPIDMLKRQWYKSQYESPRHQDASQSD